MDDRMDLMDGLKECGSRYGYGMARIGNSGRKSHVCITWQEWGNSHICLLASLHGISHSTDVKHLRRITQKNKKVVLILDRCDLHIIS
jgi:hypothetical protein